VLPCFVSQIVHASAFNACCGSLWAEIEADNTLVYNTQIKKIWSYTSNSPVCPQNVVGETSASCNTMLVFTFKLKINRQLQWLRQLPDWSHIGIFKHLKYTAVCERRVWRVVRKSSWETTTIYDIPTMPDALTLVNIKSGFLVTAIWPVNIDVFTDADVSPEKKLQCPCLEVRRLRGQTIIKRIHVLTCIISDQQFSFEQQLNKCDSIVTWSRPVVHKISTLNNCTTSVYAVGMRQCSSMSELTGCPLIVRT
jgi:hypothetical protein